MDNIIWAYFHKLLMESSINNADIEIPVTSSFESFLLSREDGNFLLSDSLTSLSVLKAKKFYEQAKDIGVHSLYIGYPILKVDLPEISSSYMPLILFPVNILAKNSTWYITNNKEMDIMLNYKLIYQNFDSDRLKYDYIKMEFEDLNQFGENKLAGIINYLNENNLKIPEIQIHKACLYLISSSYSMFKDYVKILSCDKTSCLFESLINDLPYYKQEENTLNLSSKDLFLTSPLNTSQTDALIAANNLSNVILTGAKGSGKKETITNIICDSLAKGKNILVISENKEALLSIYERLSKISNKTCLLSDDPHNISSKIEFQMNIKREKQTGRILSQIKSKSENLERKIKSITDMEQVLYKKRPFGLSLQEMYSKAEAIKGKEDYRYEAFKKFQSKNLFQGFSYSQLKTSVLRLGPEIASRYEEYRNLIEDYPYLLKIKNEADTSRCDTAYKNSEDIKAAFYNLYENIKGLENFSNMTLLSLEKNFNVPKQDILFAAERILNISTGNSFKPENRLIHFIKYKNRKSNEIYRIRIEEKAETLTAYYDMILNYMEIISVLKDLLNNDFYNELIEDALNGLNISDILNALFEALGKFNIFREYAHTIWSLDDLDILILSYAYENSEPPFDNNTLINHILDFSILSQIKYIESQTSEKKSLFTCLKYNELKDSIASFRTEKNNLTCDYINQVWDSRLLEVSASEEYTNLKNDLKIGLTVKALFSKYSAILTALFPVLLAAPENVSDILPLKDIFSLIIYADSSQISIHRAVPSLFRGNKLIVSGDTMFLTSEDSLLNKCKDKYYNIFLNYNYSSEREDILAFQNQNFYKDSIVISPDLRKRIEKHPGIELINIDNAIDKICRIIINGNLNRIGIAAFCLKDKEYINRELVKMEIYINKNYIYTAESFYTERDTVFIFTSGFSSMENNYKNNILNMAVSSAKRKIYLVYQDNKDEIVHKYKIYKDIINLPKHTIPLPKNKEWLIKSLINLNYNISFDLGYPPNIDIGIYDKSGRYVLGIIFDKEILYPLSLIRFYERMGWKIYRVWSRDLWLDKASVINNIIKIIGPFLK
ncbi:MAG: hypothetical protein LIR50_04640 [Bacillota bacterium]|nr:hypothetical protein [Bacillota bacterium]